MSGQAEIRPGEVEQFDMHRPRLFAIAYRMLGSVMDAEDVVQEAYLRWRAAREAGTELDSSEAWLSAVATRLCIDYLRSARVRREEYVGPWLPEPLTAERAPDVADSVALGESLSMAFLVLLESLTPVERAVFLLRDVFEYPYAEVAPIVGKSEPNCRQLARRARARVAERRPRFGSSPAEQQRLVGAFIQACSEGDLEGLLAILSEDVTLWSDGGGKVRAARRPILGAGNVARFLLGILRGTPPGFAVATAEVNGQPGLVCSVEERLLAIVVLDLAEGAIQGVRVVVNPEKLAGVRSDRGDGRGAHGYGG